MLVADAERVRELANWSDGWCVSVLLPIHPIEGKEHGDLLRLKNLLRDAELELLELGMRAPDVAQLMSEAMPEELHDPGSAVFHQAGVGLFFAPGFRRVYRLPFEAPELAFVSRRFHLKPLLRVLRHDRRFFLLAVTRGSARLFSGDRDELTTVEVPGMPASLDDAIQYDDRERALLSHSASRRGGGGVIAAFHGQGDRADHLPEDVMRYLRLVDAAVCKVIGHRDPLVLSGSRDLVPQYRDVTSHPVVVGEGVNGNPETTTLDRLHAAAWAIVDADAATQVEVTAGRFHQLNGTGLASSETAAVVAAARVGRIDSLLVASDTQLWGRFDEGTDEPVIHGQRVCGDDDLLATAAVDAWQTGADVYVVPRHAIPADSDIAAIYRY